MPQTWGDQKISPEQNSEINNLDYASKIKAIRLSLEKREGDVKELDQSFVELWKNIPEKVDGAVYDDIDAIRDLLMMRNEEEEKL